MPIHTFNVFAFIGHRTSLTVCTLHSVIAGSGFTPFLAGRELFHPRLGTYALLLHKIILVDGDHKR
jgi:hypothetical protein